MQRTRGMGRPHQGDPSSTELSTQTTTSTMPTSSSEITTSQQQQNHPPRPTRNNSKLKVLVRSHAMREETSPPRVPTPINVQAPPPCIKVEEQHEQYEQETKIFYNNSRTSSPLLSSKPLSPIINKKPCLIVSPTTDDVLSTSTSSSSTSTSTSIDNNSSLNNNNNLINKVTTTTVRTQDVLNSTISRKFNVNGDFQENKKNSDLYLNNKCENVMTSNTNANSDTTNTNNSSPKETSSNSNNSSSTSAINNNNSLNVENNTHQQQLQQNLFNNTNTSNTNNCECIKQQNCGKCLKNNELNINNNSNNINNNNVTTTTASSSSTTTNTLTVVNNRVNPRHKLRHQSSSQGSFEGSSSNSPCLSRDSSTEFYTDTHGTDLTQFLIETLNKNAKDRVFMLKVEMDLVNLAKDSSQKQYKFPAMSSYQRMLVHRCAAYFGMDHNIEPSGKAVVVSKNRNTRIPESRFKDHIREDLLFPEEPRRSILKRDSNSFEDCNYKSPDRQFDNRRSKSFEEREEEYERARRRIFKDGTMQDCGSQEEFNWAEMPWPETECTKIRLLHPEQNKQNRLLKVQSVEGRSETLRPCVAKSYSFGGYGGAVSVLSRGDSISSTHSAGPRLLTKQDSSTSTISWRLSPSSSGYKTQSQRSDSVTPSPTATPHQLSDASGKNSVEGIDPIEHSITEETLNLDGPSSSTESNQLVWAVTDMQSVPKGSVLIDPQTGQPFTNQDGTIYHFDPSNPPPGCKPITTEPVTPETPPPPPPPPIKSPSPCPSPSPSPVVQPKKQTKSKFLPPLLKSKNSATSPSLPMTPPLLSNHQLFGGYTTPIETPRYQIYPAEAAYHHPQAAAPMGMMYTTSYPTYEPNRQDAQMSELSGYFVNMAVDAQQMYQQPTSTGGVGGYCWTPQPQPQPQPQQQVTYYQAQPQVPQVPQIPQIPQVQRYPIQMAQTPPTATYYPATYPPGPQLTNAELVPIQMVYQPQPQSNTPLYIQNTNPPSIVYAQNTMYPPQPQPIQPIQSIQSIQSPSTPGIYNTHCYQKESNTSNRSTPRNNNSNKQQQCFVQKTYYPHPHPHGSGGSSSPAISAYNIPNSNTPISYRQCTPPETPPFGYPQPQPQQSQHQPQQLQQSQQQQHSIIFRQMGGIRASPPVNVRSSRSPTPAPEYIDRSQRYTVPTTVYHGMPAIIPGDMRMMGGRNQPPVYRQQSYRQQQPHQQHNQQQQQQQQQQQMPSVNHHENSSGPGRPHKMRKPRTKVTSLPPSGRQSNQSIQQRY